MQPNDSQPNPTAHRGDTSEHLDPTDMKTPVHPGPVPLNQGLTPNEVTERRARYGWNDLPVAQPMPAWRQAAGDPVTAVLLAMSMLSLVLQDGLTSLLIMAIGLVHAVIGLLLLHHNRQILGQLMERLAVPCTVLRDGRKQQVLARELVPEDGVLLQAGDQVPADLLLLDCADLQVDESPLTGKPTAVVKHPAALPSATSTPHQDAAADLSQTWRGSFVAQGRAVGRVTATGQSTRLGQLFVKLAGPSSQRKPQQPHWLAWATLLCWVVTGVGLLVSATGLWSLADSAAGLNASVSGGQKSGLGLGLGWIPQVLLIAAAVLMALKLRRMRGNWLLARQLHTVRRPSPLHPPLVSRPHPPLHTRLQVTAIHTRLDPTLTESRTASAALWRAAALCNNARPTAAPPGTALRQHWVGSPDDCALMSAAAATHRFDLNALQQRLPRLQHWPQGPDHPLTSTLHQRRRAAGQLLLVRGDPETLLPLCSHFNLAEAGGSAEEDSNHQRAGWLRLARQLGTQGLQVLAFAQRRWPGPPLQPPQWQDPAAPTLEQDLEFIGLIGLTDGP